MNPWLKDPWLEKNPGPFREGDRVRFPFGVIEVEGTVVEDRGNLGVGGKRLYGVTFRADDVSDPLYTEMEAEELKLVTGNGKSGATNSSPS
jgi:hypothetical protein